MRVLGIDPGSQRTGFGLVEQQSTGLRSLAMGVVRPRGTELGMRLAEIAGEIERLIVEWRPDAIALERAFMGKNVASALRLGEVRGAILAGAGRQRISVVDYPPATVKVAVAGIGNAGKEMVARGVMLLLGGQPKAGDATDALAVAICHLRHSRFAARLHTGERTVSTRIRRQSNGGASEEPRLRRGDEAHGRIGAERRQPHGGEIN